MCTSGHEKFYTHPLNFLCGISTQSHGEELNCLLGTLPHSQIGGNNLSWEAVEVLLIAIFRIDQTEHLIRIYWTCTCSCKVCLFFFFFFGVQISSLLASKKLTLKNIFSKLNSLTWPPCMFLQPQIRSSTNLNLVVFLFFLCYSSLLLPQGKNSTKEFPNAFLPLGVVNRGNAESSLFMLHFWVVIFLIILKPE